MRPIMKTTMCALVAAAVAAPAHAAINAYLELGPIKGESAARSGKPVPSGVEGTKHIEILSWSWGATMAGDWDGTIKGATGAGKFGAVGGMHRDEGVTSPRNAAGRATGKRQHGWVTVAKPLDRGAVRVKVKFPWLDCRVGAAFPDAVLQNDAGRYEFKDAIITGCSSGGEDRPMESLSLNYAKVQVRGWDPAKK